MRQLVKDHSLTVGYNCTGQPFFDLLNQYNRFIHSYFFSFTYSMRGEKYNVNEICDVLKRSNQYDIPANLLLNDDKSYENYDYYINLAKDVCNLTAVTVLKPDIAKEIKQKYPELEIHLSVRFWDWNNDDDINTPINIFYQNLTSISGYIDVINISGAKSYNDRALFDAIKNEGIKTKFIINEGCIVGRAKNWSNLPGYEGCSCAIGTCYRLCDRVINDYPWMGLTTINIFKETLKFFDYDILKISSRCLDNDTIDGILENWANGLPTNHILVSANCTVDITDKYPTFLDWVETRSKCCNDCNSCRACEYFYNDIIKSDHKFYSFHSNSNTIITQDHFISFWKQKYLENTNQDFSLYIHYPFCASLCKYCTWGAELLKDHVSDINFYIEDLVGLIRNLSDTVFSIRPIGSIIFGGGTASLIPKDILKKIMDIIPYKDQIPYIKMEITPYVLTKEYIDFLFYDCHFTFLTWGVQTFDIQTLNENDRKDVRSDMFEMISYMRKLGFNSNIDFISGLTDNIWDLMNNLEIVANNEAPDSITIYPNVKRKDFYEVSYHTREVLIKFLEKHGDKFYIHPSQLTLDMKQVILDGDDAYVLYYKGSTASYQLTPMSAEEFIDYNSNKHNEIAIGGTAKSKSYSYIADTNQNIKSEYDFDHHKFIYTITPDNTKNNIVTGEKKEKVDWKNHKLYIGNTIVDPPDNIEEIMNS